MHTDAETSCSLVLLPLIFFLSMSFTSSTNFSYPSFSPSDGILTAGSATVASVFGRTSIRLNDNQIAGRVFNDTGRAYYFQAIQLWDPTNNLTTDFTTYFEFSILFPSGSSNSTSGGIAFFVASENSTRIIPESSGAGWLGLFNETTDGDPANQVLAVEFDTYQDRWDQNNNHVGIDVNSIVSKNYSIWRNTLVSGDTLGATISYSGTSKILSVFLKDPQVPGNTGALHITHKVDLREVLPEKGFIGFSASTGQAIPVQAIRSWNFSSTMDLIVPGNDGKGSSKGWIVGLVIGLVVSVGGAISILGVCWRNARRKKIEQEELEDEEFGIGDYMDEDFEKGTGPKRFTYKELVSATNNFSEEGKLGQGGFGGVYKGFLSETHTEIAVKKISSNSSQGKKEYISEVKIISCLRHRNLVQLVGWSHERGSFLLVYEYMPNGSLDSHLFGKKQCPLSWPLRYKIASGLASALLYLHEEWEQCVVHRDIKSSNVMLDSNFNAKLGDFGLARLVDHGLGSQTTVLAGTMGYMAPECVITGKSSKESDVYSFGVVALEITCGRKAVEPRAEESRVSLINWVWQLYGRGKLLEAVDESLNEEFDEDEATCLLMVGLWCAHPDHNLRPSIRQAIQALNFEAPLPSLPPQIPVPMYYGPAATGSYHFTCSSWTSQEPTVSATSGQATLSKAGSSKSLL